MPSVLSSYIILDDYWSEFIVKICANKTGIYPSKKCSPIVSRPDANQNPIEISREELNSDLLERVQEFASRLFGKDFQADP